jgi:predicted GNAT superfamily acetyltransferase
MKALESLQKQVWGWNDLDVMPLMNFIAAREVGGVLIGAFDGEMPVGFVFGFVGYDDGYNVIHSHLLAVLPAYRGRGVGRKLKLAQRDQALARGYERITWTFDPLQSTNAYLNFAKLGVVAKKYKVNFYGEESSSQLHRYVGTDRLWVNWFLTSNRVKQRLAAGPNSEPSVEDLDGARWLVQSGFDARPTTQPISQVRDGRVLIEIPTDIGLLQTLDPSLALEWRNATRSAFTEAFTAGYIVDEFYHLNKQGHAMGCYQLRAENP